MGIKYICDQCKKVFIRKDHYDRHKLKKKKTCGKILISSVNEIYKCEFCSFEFETQKELILHLADFKAACFHKQMAENSLNNLSKIIDRKIDQMKPIKCLPSTKKTKNITNNNNISNVDPTKKLKFCKHGKEKIDHITRDIVLKLFQEKFSLVCVELMKLIYFNEKVPENCMWSIAYPKSDTAGVAYDETTCQFERMETIKLIEDKFENMIDLLFPLVRAIQDDIELYPTLSEMQKGNLVRFLSHIRCRIATDSPFIYEVIHKLCYEQRLLSMRIWGENGYRGNHLSLKFI